MSEFLFREFGYYASAAVDQIGVHILVRRRLKAAETVLIGEEIEAISVEQRAFNLAGNSLACLGEGDDAVAIECRQVEVRSCQKDFAGPDARKQIDFTAENRLNFWRTLHPLLLVAEADQTETLDGESSGLLPGFTRLEGTRLCSAS